MVARFLPNPCPLRPAPNCAKIRLSSSEMGHHAETPFDNLESSHEYVSLLAEAIAEALLDVEADIALADADGATRRREALQVVSFNLTKLKSQMSSSRRILNDLRTLRRLLLDERHSQQALHVAPEK